MGIANAGAYLHIGFSRPIVFIISSSHIYYSMRKMLPNGLIFHHPDSFQKYGEVMGTAGFVSVLDYI